MIKLYLGIGQHRKQLTVNLRNEAGDVVLRRQVSTEWPKVRKFFADLAERTAGGRRVTSDFGNNWLRVGEFVAYDAELPVAARMPSKPQFRGGSLTDSF